MGAKGRGPEGVAAWWVCVCSKACSCYQVWKLAVKGDLSSATRLRGLKWVLELRAHSNDQQLANTEKILQGFCTALYPLVTFHQVSRTTVVVVDELVRACVLSRSASLNQVSKDAFKRDVRGR